MKFYTKNLAVGVAANVTHIDSTTEILIIQLI